MMLSGIPPFLVLLWGLLSGFHSYAFQQAADLPASIEKTCLFTDDYVYIAGDPVWFQIVSGSPENKQLSAVAYISLVDHKGNHILQQKLMADDGVASGTLKLPDTLGTANYALLAYTRYGIATGPEYIGSQLLKIKAHNIGESREPARVLPKLFFEGGHPVHGRNRVLMVYNCGIGQPPAEVYLMDSSNQKQPVSLASAGQGYGVFDMVIEKSTAYRLLVVHNGREDMLNIPVADNERITIQLGRAGKDELQFVIEGSLIKPGYSLIISKDGRQVAERGVDESTKLLTFDPADWQPGKYKAEIRTDAGEPEACRYFYVGAAGRERRSEAGKISARQNFSVRGRFSGVVENSHVLAFVVPAAHPFQRMTRFVSSSLLVQHLLLSKPDIAVNNALIAEQPADSSPASEVWKELNIFTHAYQPYQPKWPSSLDLANLVIDFQTEEEAAWMREKSYLNKLLAFYYPKKRPYRPEPIKADKTYRPQEYDQLYSIKDFFQKIAYELKVSTDRDGEVRLRLRYIKGDRRFTYQEEPLYVIDGYIVDKKALLGISLEQVDQISLVRQQQSIDKTEIGPSAYNGIIYIMTVKGDYAQQRGLPVEQRLYKDLSLPYAFTNNPFNIRTDNLSTPYFHYPIHWQSGLPLLQHNRFDLRFRHTDHTGDFNIIIIGINPRHYLQAEIISYSVTF